MDNADFRLPVFIDASGEAYYQMSQVEKKLVEGVKYRYPKLFRRHATPQEMPTLIGLGMRPSNQKGGPVVTLVKVSEIRDILEHRGEKYKVVQLLFGAGSETIAPHTKDLKKPPFTTVQLVSQALLSSENSGLTAREIADWISNTYHYYQSIEKFGSKRASDALSKSNFFTNKRSRTWYIVQSYERRLRKNAYLPRGGKIARTKHGRFKSPLEPKVLAGMSTVQDDVSAFNASASKNIQPEVVAYINLVDDEDDEPAVHASAPQKIEPEVFDIKHLVENDGLLAFNTPPPAKIKPELLDTINLIENDETIVNSLPSKEIKPEVIIDLIDDENELKCEAISTTHQLECPITIATPHDSINPSRAGNSDIQCPICEEQFSSNEALGEHVGTHRRAPTDANEMARAALQNITASLCGRNPESPIIVFSGNVYLTSKNPPTP